MILLLIISLAVFVSISLPIGISLGLSTVIALIFMTDIDTVMVAQTAFASLDSFTLMAIPFFMLAGNLHQIRRNFKATAGSGRSYYRIRNRRTGSGNDVDLHVLCGDFRLRPCNCFSYRIVHDAGYEGKRL